MKSSIARTLLIVLVALATLPFVFANPAYDAWDALGSSYDLIIPDYQGNTALFIDALILFFLIVFPVKEIMSKKIKSGAANWAMGIMIWLPLVVYKQYSGFYMLRSVGIGAIAWLIFTLQISHLLFGVFEKFFSTYTRNHRKRVKITAFALALGAVSIGMVDMLANMAATTAFEKTLQGIIGVAAKIAGPIGLISGTFMAITAPSGAAAAGVGIAALGHPRFGGGISGTASGARKAGGIVDSLKQKVTGWAKNTLAAQQQKEAHLQRIKKWEGDIWHLLDAEAIENAKTLQELKTYLTSLGVHLKQTQQGVQQYADWIKTNNATLPAEYQQAFEEQAARWDKVFTAVAENLATHYGALPNTLSEAELNFEKAHAEELRASAIWDAIEEQYKAGLQAYTHYNDARRKLTREVKTNPALLFAFQHDGDRALLEEVGRVLHNMKSQLEKLHGGGALAREGRHAKDKVGRAEELRKNILNVFARMKTDDERAVAAFKRAVLNTKHYIHVAITQVDPGAFEHAENMLGEAETFINTLLERVAKRDEGLGELKRDIDALIALEKELMDMERAQLLEMQPMLEDLSAVEHTVGTLAELLDSARRKDSQAWVHARNSMLQYANTLSGLTSEDAKRTFSQLVARVQALPETLPPELLQQALPEVSA